MATYELSVPVSHNEKEYKTLTFREAEVGDLVLADNFEGDMSKTVAILASISDVPLPAFKKIKAKDLNGILEATKEVLGESL